MIAPDAGDIVKKRLRGMGIFIDVGDGEIRLNVTGHQSHKSECNKKELRNRGRAGHTHECKVVPASAIKRHADLHQRKNEGKYESIVAEFGNHRVCSFIAFIAPWPEDRLVR